MVLFNFLELEPRVKIYIMKAVEKNEDCTKQENGPFKWFVTLEECNEMNTGSS